MHLEKFGSIQILLFIMCLCIALGGCPTAVVPDDDTSPQEDLATDTADDSDTAIVSDATDLTDANEDTDLSADVSDGYDADRDQTPMIVCPCDAWELPDEQCGDDVLVCIGLDELGGSLDSTDGSLSLTFPEGAVAEGEAITIGVLLGGYPVWQTEFADLVWDEPTYTIYPLDLELALPFDLELRKEIVVEEVDEGRVEVPAAWMDGVLSATHSVVSEEGIALLGTLDSAGVLATAVLFEVWGRGNSAHFSNQPLGSSWLYHLAAWSGPVSILEASFEPWADSDALELGRDVSLYSPDRGDSFDGETRFGCEDEAEVAFGGTLSLVAQGLEIEHDITVELTEVLLCEDYPAGGVSGTVYVDVDQDLTYDSGEPGASSLEIVVSRLEGELELPILGRFLTNNDGEYTASPLPPGRYVVSLPAERLPRTFVGVATPETVLSGAGSISSVPAFPVWVEGQIQGTVRIDNDHDRVPSDIDPQASEVELVLYRLTDSDPAEIADTVTDELGRYEFGGLPPAEYEIRVVTESIAPEHSTIPGFDRATHELAVGEQALVTDILISTDADADGLDNVDELIAGSSIELADSDGDGLLDGAEVNELSTDPIVPDSDGDGLSDGEEVLVYETVPIANADSDGDTLSDFDEVYVYGTNPAERDSDRDGVTDEAELEQGSNPRRADPDGDGLTDSDETRLGTRSDDSDSDSDGFSDGAEVGDPIQPANADSDDWIDAVDSDSDGDGLSDVQESFADTVHADDDGVENVRDRDSDGDEKVDGEDNCPFDVNPSQLDEDGDLIGDECDPQPDQRCSLEEETDTPQALDTGRLTAPDGYVSFDHAISGPQGDRYTLDVCAGGRVTLNAFFDAPVVGAWEWTDHTSTPGLLSRDNVGEPGEQLSAQWTNDSAETVAIDVRLALPPSQSCAGYQLQASVNCACQTDDVAGSTSGSATLMASRGTRGGLWIADGEEDWFEIPVCDGGTLDVFVDSEAGPSQVGLAMLDLDENTLATEEITGIEGSQGVRYTPGEGVQSALVRISGWEDACYSYRLRTRLSDCPAWPPSEKPTSIVEGVLYGDQTSSPSDPDVYDLAVCGGGTLTVDAVLLTGSDVNNEILEIWDGSVTVGEAPHPDFSEASVRRLVYRNTGDVELDVELTVAGWMEAAPIRYALITDTQCPCEPPDPFEPNDTGETASELTDLWEPFEDLRMSSQDADWFSIPVCERGDLLVDAVYGVEEADFEVLLHYRSPGFVVSRSTSLTGRERATYTNPLSQRGVVMARVTSQTGANECLDYTLDVDLECPCFPDILEDDDTFGTGTPVGETVEYERLRITPGDPDYFIIEACSQGEIVVDATFADADGDIDIELFPAGSGTPIRQGVSRDDNEHLEYTVPFAPPAEMALVVTGRDNGSCPYYDLAIQLDCPVDRDGDGVPDDYEIGIGSNPDLEHSDADGISDGDEVYVYGTNPSLEDTDEDGLSDDRELFETFTEPYNPDMDGGGLWDGDEVTTYHTDPYDPSDDLVMLTTNPLPNATVGELYEFAFEAVGGRADHEWVGLVVPFGSIGSDGQWVGTPAVSGARTVRVRVESNDSNNLWVEKIFDLTMVDP